jgi:gamma-glutamyltranspeptidase/glutathione hydrolase
MLKKRGRKDLVYWRRSTGRSDVIAKEGMVATSQPLATQAGLAILKKGGNAIDAAIAAAAVLDVVEPMSTGCGGDAFALVHKPDKKTPLCFNGSGRSGSLATLEDLLELNWTEMPLKGGPTVTVPGAMHFWCWLMEKYGSLELKDVFANAIHYACDGFPVSPLVSEIWQSLIPVLRNDAARETFMIHDSGPKRGEIMRNEWMLSIVVQSQKQ